MCRSVIFTKQIIKTQNPLFNGVANIDDHFVLLWKSNLERVIQTPTLECIHYDLGVNSSPDDVIPNMTPKRVDFHSTALREMGDIIAGAKCRVTETVHIPKLPENNLHFAEN